MSDAGKVMIDSSGNLILGANGKAVLADDLYPASLSVTRSFYFRTSTTHCAATNIWSGSWASTLSEVSDAYYYVNGASSRDDQRGAILTFDGSSIDWQRVKKVRIDGRIRVYTGYELKSGMTFRITKAKDVSAMPSGTDVRDVWDTAQAFAVQPEAQNLSIEWDVNGVEPSSVAFCVMFDSDECSIASNPGSSLAFLDRADNYALHIIYNLAT